jgi:cytochrome c peroxidase
MEGDFLKILDFLSEDSEYSSLFHAAFHTPPTVFGITRAIAAYEKSLNFLNSPYDKYIQGDSLALTEAEIRGMDLFFSEKLNCTSCHSGNLFTDYSYRNIGIEHQFQDSGRARITLLPEDAGKFEVPSLRNVGVTAPYMHDGSFETLEEVVRYLEIGGGTHPNKSALVQPFSLSDAERKDLVAFLNALTDEAFQN